MHNTNDPAEPGIFGPASDDMPLEPDTTAGAPAPATDLDALARERDEFKDLLLRKSAEFDNYRKRIERERREQAELANADLLRDLLPTLDDLERALRTDATDNLEAYRRGVELIGKRFADVLARRGVTPIDPLGAEFDPHEHEAVTHGPAPGAREGEVVEVLSRGYRLKDRLLRPAMVKVASA
jgi:molecular chaperone GrpE